MKLVKMRNVDSDNFDAFLQNKLQNFDVDKSKADRYIGDMKFPVPLEERSFWKVFYLYFFNNKKIIATIAALLFSGIAGFYYFKSNVDYKFKNKDTVEMETVKSIEATILKESVNKSVSKEYKNTGRPEKSITSKEAALFTGEQTKASKNPTVNQQEKMAAMVEKKLVTPEGFKKEIIKDSILLKVKANEAIEKKDTINIIW